MTAQGDSKFPAGSLSDWKSYADHLVTFRVIQERELPPDPESGEAGEGMIGRIATIRVDRRMWSASNTPQLPEEFEMTVAGWVFSGDERAELAFASAPRLTVGERYLAPVLFYDEKDTWGLLAGAAALPLRNDRVTLDGIPERTPLQTHLSGLTPIEIAERFAAAEPDPDAWKYRGLRPHERVEAVASGISGTG